MSRENILHKIRTALGRSAGQAVADGPAARIVIPEMEMEERIQCMRTRIEALAGRTMRAANGHEARDMAAAEIGGRTALASNSPFLRECGITELPGVRSGITDREELRQICATIDVGITSADYVLADTGTLVMIASPAEARLISLLPPVHLAVVPKERILTGLDELFSVVPQPAEITSSMVMITGPSRTADIEQFLVRGVHGPGAITVVVVG